MAYTPQPFPKYIFKLRTAPRVVQTQAELDAALADGWSTSPVGDPVKLSTVRILEGNVEENIRPVDPVEIVILEQEPIEGSLQFFWNGLRMTLGFDYSIVGRKITLVQIASSTSDILTFLYRRY